MKTIARTLVATALLTAGAATAQEGFPELDPARTQASVAVLRFDNGRHLPEDPRCERLELLCLDPPPLVLDVTVERQLYGPPLPPHFTLFTTSHYGLQGYDFARGEPSLVLVLDDGSARVMPRYSRAFLARDAGGRLAVPVEPYPVPWLPCDVMEHRVPVRGWGADLAGEIGRDAGDPEVVAAPQMFVVEAGVAMPRYGLYVEDVAETLGSLAPVVDDFRCEQTLRRPLHRTIRAPPAAAPLPCSRRRTRPGRFTRRGRTGVAA